jgi:hypothetical protein
MCDSVKLSKLRYPVTQPAASAKVTPRLATIATSTPSAIRARPVDQYEPPAAASAGLTGAVDEKQSAPMPDCRVQIPNSGNNHHNYDAKFRACRLKAATLGYGAEEQRSCVAVCMKN